MKSLRTVLVAGLAIGLSGAPVPALAAGTKQVKGVVEKLDASDRHLVIRETYERKRELPLTVAADAKIVTPAGAGSFASLHVGDEVTVHYGTGSKGEEATEIQVTKPAPAQ